MATHTVYGCLLADGTIEFDDTASGCEGTTITGCLVKSGEHAGQVEITHDYGGCETQYYACLDPATGKFQFEADDGCCGGGPSSYCSGNCSPCYGYGVLLTPRFIEMAFEGIDNCVEYYDCSIFHDSFILECLPASACMFQYLGGGIRIQLGLYSPYTYLNAHFYVSFFPACFIYQDEDGCIDTAEDMPNQIPDCMYVYPYYRVGINGTASWNPI